jgi:hypothetical protein
MQKKKIHSKRVGKMLKITLEPGGEDVENYTRNEWRRYTYSQLAQKFIMLFLPSSLQQGPGP